MHQHLARLHALERVGDLLDAVQLAIEVPRRVLYLCQSVLTSGVQGEQGQVGLSLRDHALLRLLHVLHEELLGRPVLYGNSPREALLPRPPCHCFATPLIYSS